MSCQGRVDLRWKLGQSCVKVGSVSGQSRVRVVKFQVKVWSGSHSFRSKLGQSRVSFRPRLGQSRVRVGSVSGQGWVSFRWRLGQSRVKLRWKSSQDRVKYGSKLGQLHVKFPCQVKAGRKWKAKRKYFSHRVERFGNEVLFGEVQGVGDGRFVVGRRRVFRVVFFLLHFHVGRRRWHAHARTGERFWTHRRQRRHHAGQRAQISIPRERCPTLHTN